MLKLIAIKRVNKFQVENELLKQELSALKQSFAVILLRLQDAEALAKSLQEQLNLSKNGRNSGTSSTPPSHDIARSNTNSLREKSGKKSGGQHGHEGTTLLMKADPDEIIEYKPYFCKGCGNALHNHEAVLKEFRQEIIIPPIQACYLEHRSYSNNCDHCGLNNVGEFPSNITAPIQYGASVSATLAYLFAYHYLPYKRIKTLVYDLFKLPISEGTIDNQLAKMKNNAMFVYNEIQNRLQRSTIVGGDETGTKINGLKGWFHVWQNKYLTYIVAAMNRGYKTTEEYFPKGFKMAVYVSDCWSAQLKTIALLHQLCLAHLLRELSNFEGALNCQWSVELKLLLKKAIALKQELKASDYLHPPPSVQEIEHQLTLILDVDTKNFHPKTRAFVKRLIKNRSRILTFLYYSEVPYDNNGSERAIRNVKVKNKVSGGFRSQLGAERFAILRSIIDTSIKNSQDIFTALTMVAKYSPE